MRLTAKRLREVLHYDPLTGAFTWRARLSNIRAIGSRAGTVNKRGRRYIGIDDKLYCASRLAWLYVHGVWPEDRINQKNQNHTDDRLENLRLSDRQKTAASRAKFKGKSLPKGVNLQMKSRPRYRARIRVNGSLIHLGYFDTPDAASSAYAEAARKYFGEFARAA